jgi:hypothetical protein
VCDLQCLCCEAEKLSQPEMLRITIEEGERAQTIKLDGKMAGPWVEELDRTWRLLVPSLGGKQLVIDMRNVTFVDGKGRQLLREIHQQTAACFLTDSLLTRYFADEAMRPSSKDGKKGA